MVTVEDESSGEIQMYFRDEWGIEGKKESHQERKKIWGREMLSLALHMLSLRCLEDVQVELPK